MTILLDTNVVSELLRRSPSPIVEAWMGDHPATDLYFSAIGEAELWYGVAILPAGRRQAALASVIETILREDFEGRILSFDSAAARYYADIAAFRRTSDRLGGLPDRSHYPVSRHGGGDPQCPGLRGYRHRYRRPLDSGMSGTTEAFARAKIDALLKDAGWDLTDSSSVLFEHALPDGTQTDYVLCDRQGRPMAALEAKRASIDPITAQDQGRHYAEQLGVFQLITVNSKQLTPYIRFHENRPATSWWRDGG